MRRLSAVLAGAALASSGLVMLTSAPTAFASECGATGGTVPGTPAQATTVDLSPVAIFYIDDRDFADADGDGVSQGIWIYMESNGQPGLQNGGADPSGNIPVDVPHVDPLSIDGPDPVGHVITLFPNGFGGGSLAEALGGVDPCNDISGTHDTVIF
jgi:hypothetical protein